MGHKIEKSPMQTMEFFLNVFTKFSEFSDKKPVTSCVRDQEALNWAQFMLQWFIRFPEFIEFNGIT